MKKQLALLFFVLATLLSINLLSSCNSVKEKNESYFEEENDEYDGAGEAIEFEIERTKNPFTGKVPWDKLREAIEQTNELRSSSNLVNALNWIERGPNGDFTIGGNPRANNDQTSGRIRASMVDSLDPTKKTVWIGGVNGGLWKTTDITVAPSNWTLVNDNLANLAVSAICQDPRPGFQNNMYFCTGESYGNADAVRGIGVFKSTDAGNTWSLLSSTAAYISCTRIVCDNAGNVYLGTRNTGLLRSSDGGSTWTVITPSGTTSVSDLEISSTGRMHVTAGMSGNGGYVYTDNPATVTSATWTSPATPFTFSTQRIEFTVNGNILFALPSISSQVPTIWKSTDGGANWAATTGQPTSGWASGQGWYALSAGINPSNTNQCIVGGLDCFRTMDGGATWTRISTWVNSGTEYVHADQHNIQWWDGGNKLMFNCDGGVHYSSNGGATGITIRDRNKGLRIKQFYSVAIHPASGSNYFLAGAQDNGMHRMNHPGLDSSIECVGGDGCYAAIDQNEPNFQFGSYVYNVYRRSTNSGLNWSTPVNDQSSGRFVNPWDYDNINNKIYACYNAGNFLRWNNPQTGNSTDIVSVTAFAGGNVASAHASPYTANKVYFGMGSSGRIVAVDNADVGTALAGTDITPAGATGYVNCVVTGSSDQFLMATMSNYGINNVWVSTNGGTSWTACDGNLPDMPVRWALFHPDDNSKAFIATETGVWETDLLNGASTVWTPNNTFPNVRTDMIKYRASDRTIAAGTHGRGIWSSIIPNSNCVPASITTQPTSTTACAGASTTFSVVAAGTAPLTYQWQENNGSGWVNIGGATSATYTFTPTVAQNGYQYRCNVTGNCVPFTVTSNAVTLTVNAPPTITSQPNTVNICTGSNTGFNVVATGLAPLTYQWQISTVPGCNGPWTNLSNAAPYTGVTTPNLVITGATSGMNGSGYRCFITNSCAPTGVFSNCAALNIVTSPAVTSNPSNLTVCAGNTASFTVAGSNTTGYQWQENNGSGWVNIGGATSATYSFTAALAQNNYQYRCILSGACAPTATSNPATLSVATALVINSQPASTTICETTNTSFNIGITGTVISYQWQLSTDGGINYTNIVNNGTYGGATTANLSLTGATALMNGYRYRCAVTGNCPTINSAAAILTVNTAPAITAQPIASRTICDGNNTSYTVNVTGTALTYQWQVSSNGGGTFTNLVNGGFYSGVNTATLSITAAIAGMNGYQYRCVISGTCSPSATSAIAALVVNTPVSITTQPVAKTICETGNTSFTLTAAGTSPTYQWQVSTNGGTTYTNVPSATTNTLSLTGVTTSMNGNLYRCVVTGAAPCGVVTSGAVGLTVSTRPVVGLAVSPYTSLFPGLTTTLTASSSVPSANASYAWYYNNVLFNNTGLNYLVDVNKLGSYKVVVTDIVNGCMNESAVKVIGDSASSKLFIYPSPNNGQFNVAYHNPGGNATAQTLAIFDNKGAMVYSKKLNVSQSYQIHKIDLRANSSGVYFVVLGDAAGNRIKTGEVLVR